ncbi:MAG: 30S ribosomal protein S7 [Chloroflexi bacterium]|nr:30S ribosomal protein S7 [Chloroflexota bacterium]
MSRRRSAERRILPPDPAYNNVELSKFINCVMQKGKKTTAQRIIYSAFDIIREEANREPLEVFQQAMRNATPAVEVRPKRVGGATYQIPTELRPVRSEALAIRWLIRGARSRKGIPMRRGLANELMEASRGEGSAVRRKEELHRMAEANRAFVHFRR